MTVIQQLNKILQGLLTNPIVAEYDTDGWHVVKCANGRCTATKDTTVNPTTNGSVIGSTYAGNAGTPPPSGVFTEFKRVWVSTTFGNGVWVEPYRITSETILIAVLRGAALSTTWDIPVSIKVEGSWK